MSEPEWPKPSDHAQPAPLRAAESPFKATAAAFFCFGIAGLVFHPPAAAKQPGLLVQFVGAAAAVAGCAMLWKCYRLWRQPDVALELTARGLSWPATFEKVIPWSEVTGVAHKRAFALSRRGGAGVHVQIRDFERFRPKWAKNVWGLDVSQVKLASLPLPRMLDVDPKSLFEAIQAHRAHFGRGGRPAGT